MLLDPPSHDMALLNPPQHGVPSLAEITSIHIDTESDSDLSEINEPPNVDAYSSTTVSHPDTAAEEDDQASMPTDSSEEDNDAGSEDGEFEVDSAADAEINGAFDGRSVSQQSIASTKREEFDVAAHMQEHPEVYDIRRSVDYTSDENDDSSSDVVSGRPIKRRKAVTSQKPSRRVTPARRTSSTSSSDSDEYSTTNRKASKKGRRRFEAGTLSEPSHAEQRFSSRRAAKIASYNEEDDEALSEGESDILTPNNRSIGVDESVPGIDVVLNHRVKEGIGKPESELERDDFEFFVWLLIELHLHDLSLTSLGQIKWQNKAHYHATWETTTSLSSYRGIRRLDNYMRKVVAQDIHVHCDPDVPPEEKEQWSLDRERDADVLRDCMKVERVIGGRQGEDGSEYLIKWKSLTYDCSTWEAASLVSEIAQPEIDCYLDRTSRVPVSNRLESSPTTRRKFMAIEKQPSYVKYGRLRDFQLTGLNFLAYNWVQSRNVILADEMGLGKTVQTVAFMNWLRHGREQQGPFLVVVPLSTIPAWAETMDNWTPDINYVVYNGKEVARDVIKEYELLVDGNSKRPKFHVLLTTYEYILQDAGFLSQIKWQFMAVDEAHRLKNRDSQLYSKLLEFKAPSRLLITGTPVQNSLGELSALMDFLMPGVVKIEEDMVLQPDDKDTQKKLSELHKVIEPYILRRTKKKVENDLPPKIEKIMRIGLSDIQLEYYKNILTRNYSALNQGSKGHKQSLLNIMMELKKISNHPFMFPSAEERLLAGRESRQEILRITIESSGKMILLNKLLDRLKEEGHRVLIFSQMVKMLDILGDYLRLRGFQFQRLDGTISASSRRLAIDHFNAPDSNDFVFLLSTRAGGLGINLMTADTVILFDSDWNPQADLQAMARAHRIGQTKPVTIYRFLARETVEEEVLERARNKRFLEYLTIQRGVTDKDKKELTQKGIKNGKIAEPTRADDLSRILKRRGQKMFEQQGNQQKLEEVDLDDILAEGEILNNEGPDGEADGGEEFLKSFEYTDVNIDNITWDMIIPKDELDKIKIEEKKKADEKYLAEVIEQNAPRKRKAASDEREQRAMKKRVRDTAASDLQEKLEDKADLDPKRPLSEKELRNLFKAFQRYGALEDRGEELVQDAGLVGRDHDLLKATLEEVTKMSTSMMERERQRLEEAEKESSKPLTKKDRKAVLFDYKGVKRLNAETILSRPHEMRMIREAIRTVPDTKNFRIPEASKAAHYTCPWGAREDGMLCVGIDKHGYGAWVAIRDDLDLGMRDKFFLEEHRVDKKEERVKGDEKNPKSPGAVHLVRRADYLLSVLKEKTSDGTNAVAKKAVQNHHRNNKRNGMQSGKTEKPKSVSNSPAPSSRNIHREKPMYLDRFGQIEHRPSKRGQNENGVKPDIKRKSSDGDDDRDRKRYRTSGDGLSHESKHGPERKHNYGGQARLDTGRKINGLDSHDRLKARRTDDRHGHDGRGHDDVNGPDVRRKRRDGEFGGDKSERRHRKSDETVDHRENRYTENGYAKLDTKQKRGDGASKPDERRENPHERDEILHKLFKPVRPSLKRVQRATQEIHRGSKQERAQILKTELLAIGDHVKTLWDEKNKTMEAINLGKRLWDYVAVYWPNPGVGGAALKQMYERVVESEKQRALQGQKQASGPGVAGAEKVASNAQA
ncbi:hypothetical protein FGG08_001688 [Glutinoglossum americanum]|uniref:Chromodomain-helicase-DNA-binding protein 1 n=1 Tax=Glutinoglossum americanum TaxID=1670608 RepID=A0A9P8I1L0_9PEZI|nr:hypothetical protein FGG08_001688 [Glutinoglossum americanum]